MKLLVSILSSVGLSEGVALQVMIKTVQCLSPNSQTIDLIGCFGISQLCTGSEMM